MVGLKFVLLLILCVRVVQGEYKKITIKTSDTIKSPNYPNKYPANTTIEWELVDEESVGKWKVIFTEDIKMEKSDRCENDYLEITEGIETLQRYCGPISKIPPIMSKGPKLNIKFNSNGYEQSFGFKLEVVHIMSKADRDRLKKNGDGIKGMRADVIHQDEKPTPLFIVLLVVLAIALLVFVSLLIALAVGIRNRRRRQALTKPRSVIGHIQFTTPTTSVQVAKRYSRPSITERQDSLPLNHKKNAARAVLLSTGSTRYV